MSRLLVQRYLRELETLKRVSGVTRESVVREAFKDLLKAWGRSHDLQFIAEHEYITPTKSRVYVDGALLHALRVPFGYWEAKDTNDDLEAEIVKKFAKGYPKSNIVFEDSRTAVLFQNGMRVLECSIEDEAKIVQLLELFFSYERPEIAQFHKAIEQFKVDLPAVLAALRARIDDAYAENEAFRADADAFLKQAKQTINPTVSEADVREMLIQHILTEDIFARVFGEVDFHRENNVAKALYALEAKFFRGAVKHDTLKALSPYYAAINATAALISSHSEKQGFLKAIYENFYKVYNPKAADRLGVVYTPNEIVRFMVESADWLCEKHFGRTLIDKNVEILDPATGTGTFIVELLQHFSGQKEKLRYKYLNELHANEVAILPYYVANLNIEATYAAIMEKYEEFPNLCFVDTLDNVAGLGIYAGHQHDMFAGISDVNVERVKRQNQRKISVIIGNPPYNAWQGNYNQRNPNRPYKRVDERIAQTYVREGTAQNKSSVYDMYTRFVRWASDRIKEEGVIAFIIGRKPISKAAYDGFRKVVAREFADIYIVDLGGDVRDNPKLSGTKHNVFGIQTGVTICFLVKRKDTGGALIHYARRPETEAGEDKREFLTSVVGISNVDFQALLPNRQGDWLDQSDSDWGTFLRLGDPTVSPAKARGQQRTILGVLTNGLQSKRDEWVYDFSTPSLEEKIEHLIAVFNSVDATRDSAANSIKWDADLERHKRSGTRKKFSAEQIQISTFRPFVKKLVYFDRHFNSRVFRLPDVFPNGQTNIGIAVGSHKRAGFGALALDALPNTDLFLPDVALVGGRSRFSSDGTRLDNITDWALDQFNAHYGGKPATTKDDIFAYVYAVLHDPIYRETYALNLKREFPRIPFYPRFARWRDWGRALLDLHIGYETAAPFPLARTDAADVRARSAGVAPAVKLKADREAGVITLDSETRLSGVPTESWDYKLGNRSAIDWVLDQHKEKTPKDPTIRERFNTYRFADHKERVVDLLQRITTVSVETVRIVEEMRAEPR